jgi:Pyruvate/2-oxoacid:ferredoxin oxidoreductase gamma subunit
MNSSKPFNIILAGVGGQGVLTLSKVFWKMCEHRNLQVQGSVYKGGAQQLGSIHAIIRIFFEQNADYHLYSPQIVEGDLDLILGLEPWETLRYAKYFSEKTNAVTNTHLIPIETARYQTRNYKPPLEQLKELRINLAYSDFSKAALEKFGTKKMANYLLVERAIVDRLIPFSQDELTNAFLEVRGESDSRNTASLPLKRFTQEQTKRDKEISDVEPGIKLER